MASVETPFPASLEEQQGLRTKTKINQKINQIDIQHKKSIQINNQTALDLINF